MADMLDALDVVPGSRVLEIGTGSGYNAALLSRLTQPRLVTTVDRSAKLVDVARERLRSTLGPGPGPTVVLGDGAAGAAAGFATIALTPLLSRADRSLHPRS